MHRFIGVRGHTIIRLKHKNLAAWAGSTQEFHQVIVNLQESGEVSLVLSTEEKYVKGRKPRLPVATRAIDHDELHWHPMVITYTGK